MVLFEKLIQIIDSKRDVVAKWVKLLRVGGSIPLFGKTF